MTQIGVLPSSLFDALNSPHVALTFLLDCQFGSGRVRMHPGWGTLTVGGNDWYGVTDPSGKRTVSIGATQLQEVNVAGKVDIALAGVDITFLREVRRLVTEDYREVEGRPADIYLAVFNPETLEPVTGLINWFPDGRMTAPSFAFDGIGQRAVTLSIESPWSAKNFAPGGQYTTATQRLRYRGQTDEFFKNVGGRQSYRWPK